MSSSADSNHSLPKSWIFAHGWAMDRRCWKEWTEAVESSQVFDRGFFGAPQEVSKPEGEYGVATHSMGLHLLDRTIVEGAKLLVVTAGFRHFYPTSWMAKQKTQFILQMMEQGMRTSPKLVLEKFYRMLQEYKLPDYALPEGAPNVELLLADLQRLHTSEFAFGDKRPERIVVIHGTKDEIVPVERAEDLAAAFSGELHLIEKADHAVTFTHVQQCLSYL